MATGLTTEEALKMKAEGLEEQLKTTTDQLAKANDEITKNRANEADRLRKEILDRSSFKAADLEKMTLEDLHLLDATLDRASIPKVAGVKKSIDERKATDGLSVGRWDPVSKAYIGGL